MFPELSTGDVLLRITVAGLLGGLVGLDRELSDQPAGLRTHILVSLGAALFTLVGAYGVAGFEPDPRTGLDPTRVAAQVVTGIGFLGAGAIIRQGANIRGLTTAAGLWVTAAIGMAVGLGYWAGAMATTVAAVLALFGLKRLERRLLHALKPGRFEYVVDAKGNFLISQVAQLLDQQGCRIVSVRMDDQEGDQRRLLLQVRLSPGVGPDDIADRLKRVEGILSVAWKR